jgi:hypothetical protein
MKNTAARAWIAVMTVSCAVLLLPHRAAGQGAAGAEVLTNESVVQMVVGKVPKDLILAKIQSTSTAFDVTANGLVSLYQRKVPTDMMKAMIQASAGNPENKELLTNAAVVSMVASGLPRDIITAKILSSKPGYDLTTDGLVNLNLNKVPQPVVKAMMASAAAPPPAPPPAQAAAPPRPVSPPSNAAPAAAPAAARGSTRGAGTQDKDTKAPPADTKK